MTRYEAIYGTDWDTVDKEQAVERAYALGVEETLGEYDRDELKRLLAAMDTSYNQSLVELAFKEGKKEAKECKLSEGDEDPWSSLVEGETVEIDEEDVPTGGRDGLPETLDSLEAIERPNPGENEAVDRPDFLDR